MAGQWFSPETLLKKELNTIKIQKPAFDISFQDLNAAFHVLKLLSHLIQYNNCVT